MITAALFLISSNIEVEVSSWLYLLTVIQDLGLCRMLVQEKKPD